MAWGMLSLIGIYWRPFHAPSTFNGCVPFRHGHWLRRELAQKSLFSLCYHWSTVSDRGRRVPALRRAHDPRQPLLGLTIPSRRRRHRVSAGAAVCGAVWLGLIWFAPSTL